MFFWELSNFYCDCFLFFFLFLLNFLELFWTFISITSVHTLKRWSQANRPKTGFLVHYVPLVWMWSANWNATSTSSQMKHCRKSNREGSYQLGIMVSWGTFSTLACSRESFSRIQCMRTGPWSMRAVRSLPDVFGEFMLNYDYTMTSSSVDFGAFDGYNLGLSVHWKTSGWDQWDPRILRLGASTSRQVYVLNLPKFYNRWGLGSPFRWWGTLLKMWRNPWNMGKSHQ